VILASPTTNLIDQTAEALAMAGLDKPLVTVLHSKNTGSSSVAEAVRRYYGRTNSNTDAVLLISHQAVFDTPLPIDPENWDICFDEVPDCVSFIEVEAPESHYFITRAINANPLGPEPVALYSLSPLQDNEMAIRWLHRIAWNRPKFDQGFAHLQEWARALIHGHTILVPGVQWDALMEKKPEGGHLDLLIIVPPIWFQQYRSISVMGARVTTHFTALIWSKIWQVQFKQVNLYKLPTTHSALQSRRLTVHWIFAEPVTRAFLARKAPDGGNLFVAACKSVAAFYDGKPFLWSAPQPGEDREHGVPDTFWSKAKLGYPDAFDHELRLPGRTHGLNRPEFLEACNVALLSTVHLTPTQYALLHDLELTDEQIDRALQFDVTYQDAARCNIRLADSRKPVSITVLDQRTALELAEQFPGCRVERYPEELVPRPGRRKQPGRPPSGGMSSTERSRKMRAALRSKREEAKRES
jgi:hypothetical protein